MSFPLLLKFQRLLLQFQAVERVVYVPGTKRLENDVEHSYGLAMLAWYICSKDNLSLDLNKILKYALIHDVVEVYAGDTYAYDAAAQATKKEREHKALLKLKKEFQEFPELYDTIDVYEAQTDDESQFIKALDKLHPHLLTYLDEGKMWRERGMTLKMTTEAKQKYMDTCPAIKTYFDAITRRLRKRPELFEGGQV